MVGDSRSRTKSHSFRFLGGIFRNALIMFSGESGIGAGMEYSTGRPRVRLFVLLILAFAAVGRG